MNKKNGPHEHEKPGEKRLIRGEVKVHGGIQVFEAESVIEKREADREDDKTYKDATKDYEERSLLTTRITAGITAVYLAFTCLIFIESKKAANAAKSAADTARKQLELTERPWVRVDLQVGGPLVINKTGMSFILQAMAKATGNSPAASVILESKMYVASGWPVITINEKRDAMCEDVKKRADINRKYLKSLFPGTQEAPMLQNLGVSRIELDEALRNPGERVIPLVITCAVYRSTFNETLYETAYTSTVGAIEQGGVMAVPAANDILIPPQRLLIETETYIE